VSGVLASSVEGHGRDDQSDFDMIQLDVQIPWTPTTILPRTAHHDPAHGYAWNSIRSQVVLSLCQAAHIHEYYRDRFIAEHQHLFDMVRSRDADACEKAIREHLSATYERLTASFRS